MVNRHFQRLMTFLLLNVAPTDQPPESLHSNELQFSIHFHYHLAHFARTPKSSTHYRYYQQFQSYFVVTATSSTLHCSTQFLGLTSNSLAVLFTTLLAVPARPLSASWANLHYFYLKFTWYSSSPYFLSQLYCHHAQSPASYFLLILPTFRWRCAMTSVHSSSCCQGCCGLNSAN